MGGLIDLGELTAEDYAALGIEDPAIAASRDAIADLTLAEQPPKGPKSMLRNERDGRRIRVPRGRFIHPNLQPVALGRPYFDVSREHEEALRIARWTQQEAASRRDLMDVDGRNGYGRYDGAGDYGRGGGGYQGGARKRRFRGQSSSSTAFGASFHFGSCDTRKPSQGL
ncbi:hypothetical protein MRB53_037094 [Persea americana]|nr:hypothetical protein MRB53_037094 [Persea americana]